MAVMGFVRVADVAAHAGVSPGTVSNYFHNPARVAESTAERIRAAIDDLGYVPNDAARSLRRRESRTIGSLSFEVANPYSAEFVHMVGKEARALGYAVLNASSEGDPRLQAEQLDLYVRQRVDGVVMSPIGDVEEIASRMIEHGIPLVLMDAVSHAAPSISYDDFEGGRIAAAHLIELGHRNIGFVGYSHIGIIDRRLAGVRKALGGVPGAELVVYEFDARTIAGGRRVGEKLAGLPAGERPTAVIAVNDLVAVGVLNGAFGKLRIPEDLAIIGFDDIEFASESLVPLSSVARPIDRFATRAVDMLHARIQGVVPADDVSAEMLLPQLVVRDSTAGRPRVD